MHKDTDFNNPPGRRIGALGLIRDESGAVLLVRPTYKTDGKFQLPGGGAHADEMPHVACEREVREETGLVVFPTRVLVVDYTPRSEKSGSIEGYNFVYDGGTVENGTEITLPDDELDAYQFVPLHSLSEFTNPYQERRIRAAVAVQEDARNTAFLAEGQPMEARA